MVQSGLINRPWVNAYKLTLHFMLAVLSIAAMVKTIADVYNFQNLRSSSKNNVLVLLIFVTLIQMIFAGLMSGMRAGLYYPSWPDMNGVFIPEVLLNVKNWIWLNLTNYDSFVFAPALIQFVHRMLAYILLLITGYMFVKYISKVHSLGKKWLILSSGLLILQIILGILTILNIKPGIPLFYGVSHQLVGILFFISILFLYFSLRKEVK